MADTLRLASFNVESLDARADGPPLEERIGALRPQLDRLAADILCLQEVNAQREKGARHRRLAALERVIAGTDYQDFERAISLGLKGRGLADRHNLVILSRYPIRRWRSLRHHLVKPPQLRLATAEPPREGPMAAEWDRPALQATIALPGGAVLEVLNLHLRAPLASPIPGQRRRALRWGSSAGWAEGFFLSEVKRSGQALEARLIVEEMFEETAEPLVAVCGDLNAGENETPIRILTGAVEDIGNGRLAGRELVPLARSIAPSQRYSVLHAGERALFDHLLVSRRLYGGFRRCELHNEALADEGVVGEGSPFSFHAPIVAEFELKRLRRHRDDPPASA